MKHNKHLKMFIMDYLWVVSLFIAAPVGFMVLYFIVNESFDLDALYYIFISLFVLCCFLGYRIYVTWNIYEIFCNEQNSIDDFVINDARSPEEKHYNRVMKDIRRIYLNNIRTLKDKQNDNRLMIYQWIHQLKTPLSVIGLIAENHAGEEDYYKVMQSVKQINYDLDQVLNMYKLESISNNFHVEKVNLYKAAKECINELKSMFIENSIYPKLKIEETIYVYTDFKWIKFVLYQLLTNAVKYSEEGKSVIIFVEENEKQILINIKDEGCGIDKSDTNRIFSLFFTGQNGRNRKESSGLGLYMVKKILDYLGHSITVESELDKGSTFTIVFNKAYNLFRIEEIT